ncbi:MAG: RDD family protein [Candidatus Zixiibacteriota bacterium]|nr:MAG: RDD family protein [candidate division Zixibacteria bacterium]
MKNTSEVHQPKYANLGRRFWALVIDFLILSMIFFPVTRIVKGVWIMSSGDHLWGFGWLITDPLCLIFLLVIFLYFVVLEGTLGATIGKRLLILRVVRLDGTTPGLKRALIRNLLRLVDGLPAFNILGVVLIVKSPERARFGDRVAGTRVIVRSQ